MQKYFISTVEYKEKRIMGEAVFHIKNVMRARVKDEFIVSTEVVEALVFITSITKEYIEFAVKEEIENENELPVFVDLFQGFPKGDKLDLIAKTSTQLGIHRIVPCMMKRSIAKIDDSKVESKRIRLAKIAKEAAEQSNRRYVPLVDIPQHLECIDFSMYDYKIVCYEEDAKGKEKSRYKQIVKSMKPKDKICVVVGPEGGIDSKEIEYLNSLGFVSVALGPRILRTETAIQYVLSSISFELELR